MTMSKKLWSYVDWMRNESSGVADDVIHESLAYSEGRSRLIEKTDGHDLSDEELLVEPDYTNEDEADEQSVVANIAGATTPLGTNATYPSPKVGHRKKKKNKTESTDSGPPPAMKRAGSARLKDS